jgi:hypothetical protein
LNSSIEQKEPKMVTFQIPLPGLARTFDSLTAAEKQFIEYFALIDAQCFDPVMKRYAGIGPKGYRAALVIATIIKVKEQILSDRQLAKALKKNDLYRKDLTRSIKALCKELMILEY